MKFNTHEQDRTGLQYFNARYYDPEVGRFAQADPTVPDPGNSQAFNRYMMCFGNPISLADINGFEAVTAGLGGMPSVVAGEVANQNAKSAQQAQAEANADAMTNMVNTAGTLTRDNNVGDNAPSFSSAGMDNAIANGLINPMGYESPGSKNQANNENNSDDSSDSTSDTPDAPKGHRETGPGKAFADAFRRIAPIAPYVEKISEFKYLTSNNLSRRYPGVRNPIFLEFKWLKGLAVIGSGISAYSIFNDVWGNNRPAGMSVLEALGRTVLAEGIIGASVGIVGLAGGVGGFFVCPFFGIGVGVGTVAGGMAGLAFGNYVVDKIGLKDEWK